MQGSDVLTVIAEIGVALAGFSGIVVALRQRSVENWSLPEILRLRFLLYSSALTFLFALLPFGFHHLGASPAVTWSVLSIALAFVLSGAALFTGTVFRRLRTGLSFRWGVAYTSINVITAAALLVNAVGFVGGPSFGLYLAGVAWLLLYTTTLFVRLVLAPFSAQGWSVGG